MLYLFIVWINGELKIIIITTQFIQSIKHFLRIFCPKDNAINYIRRDFYTTYLMNIHRIAYIYKTGLQSVKEPITVKSRYIGTSRD